MGGLLHHCHCGYLRALDHLHHPSSQMLAVLMTRFVPERLAIAWHAGNHSSSMYPLCIPFVTMNKDELRTNRG
jgi:hypothetical protein